MFQDSTILGTGKTTSVATSSELNSVRANSGHCVTTTVTRDSCDSEASLFDIDFGCWRVTRELLPGYALHWLWHGHEQHVLWLLLRLFRSWQLGPKHWRPMLQLPFGEQLQQNSCDAAEISPKDEPCAAVIATDFTAVSADSPIGAID